jgi:site-specific DNA-methyltransferase (adenine-specific)
VGAVVLDPFCGSGSVGVAALRNGRRFIGGDICEEAVEISRHRLEALSAADAAPEAAE